MSDYGVGPSREGDQFHYWRAARLALQLLPPGADLRLVTVEGVTLADEQVAGIDAIDLSLYYGDADPAKARKVEYRQLKHSSRNVTKPFTASALEHTLTLFAERYLKLEGMYGAADVAGRFRFVFETNRPIGASVTEAIDQLIAGEAGRHSDYFRSKIKLPKRKLRAFAKLIRLRPAEPGLLAQRTMAARDFRNYLPDDDKDAPLALKELITRKATTEFATNPDITRHDVLDAAKTSLGDLFPASNLIEAPDALVERDAVAELARSVIDGPSIALITADGGVGKSMLTKQLAAHLPAGSRMFVYDCFANGSYRTQSKYRHAVRHGFVQLANEMAGQGLCDLLIPSARSARDAYARAFVDRVASAAERVALNNTDAILCLLIDAADNAEEAAVEAGESPSFARGLWRETWPANVRLILTARPYRVEKLDPPSGIPELQLPAFSRNETGRHLRQFYPEASDADVGEFHRLTSRNPRVQAKALSGRGSLAEVFERLGPVPKDVEAMIGDLLDQAVASARDNAVGAIDQTKIDRVCTALATLRPFVPLSIIAATAGVSMEFVRSFAHDLGTPLLVREDAVQFRDEPTETWFRRKFKPDADQMREFLGRLEPLAQTSAYAASALPQLMLEAGQLDRLVSLTLAGGALPEGNAVTKRDIELQRLHFALKASIRNRRFADAAKLALKAGGETAADSRQRRLISENTDLAARFLEPDQLLEQVSRRLISGGEWTGSEHAYEAGLLAGSSSLRDDARAKLREALGWLRHWRRSATAVRKDLQAADLAELAWAELHIHGPNRCARFLRKGWKRIASWRVGLIIGRRLADAGRMGDLDLLATAAGNDFALILALNCCAIGVGHRLPREPVRRTLRFCLNPRIDLRPEREEWRDTVSEALPAVTALVQTARRHRLADKRKLAALLGRYLPKRPPYALASRHQLQPGERATYLRAYALRAELTGRALTVEQLVPQQLRKAAAGAAEHDPDYRRFRENVGALLPFHTLWARAAVGLVSHVDVGNQVDVARDASRKAQGHYAGERADINDEIAVAWAGILLAANGKAEWASLMAWAVKLNPPLGSDTLIRLTRAVGHGEGWQAEALALAGMAQASLASFREHADERVKSHLQLSRAILPVSESEAASHFEEAVRVAERIGDEGLQRWEALQALADRSADGADRPELAYRFARALELTHEYFDRDKYYDWEGIATQIAGLSPASVLAIASRWIDRHFIDEFRILPECLEALVKLGHLDARDALACFPLRANWSQQQMVAAALAAAASDGERLSIARWFVSYCKLAEPLEKHWRELAEMLEKFGVSIEAVSGGYQPAQPANLPKSKQRGAGGAKRVPWARLLNGFDPACANSIRSAVARYRKGSYGYGLGDFLKQAVSRVPSGTECEFIRQLDEAEQLNLYELRPLLDALPTSWKAQLSVRDELTRVVRNVYRREGSDAYLGNDWLPMSIWRAADATGASPSELAGEALDTVGLSAVTMDASDFFRVVSLTSLLLTPPEAQAALSHGLDLLEPAMRPEDADGPWRSALAPLPEVPLSLASYLWAALASPDAERRWEAAHAVRGLVALDREGMIADLVRLARGSTPPAAFVPSMFHFYDLHARQWFLMALARAARDRPLLVAQHAAFLRTLATVTNSHVIIRQFAASALLTLNSTSALTLSPAELQALDIINKSPFTPLDSRSGGRRRRGQRNSDFHFPFDFEQYWLAPLGRIFGIGEDEVTRDAARVIRGDWKLKATGHWKEDARRNQHAFRDERGYTSHGSVPRHDDLSFYLGYHAMMTVAGQLLASRPVIDDPYEDCTRFEYWLARRMLTRPDGYWLADRRDPTPQDCRDDEFPVEPGLLPYHADGNLIAAGSWSHVHEGTERRVTIESALVTPERAGALAAALAGSNSHMDYRIPDYGEDMAIDEGAYRLLGWVDDPGSEKGLDEHDPWAAGLAGSILTPGSSLVASLGWTGDPLSRRFLDTTGDDLLWGETWSAGPEETYREGYDDARAAHGRRILVSTTAVKQLLALGLSLLLDIRIKRNSKDRAGRLDGKLEQPPIHWIEIHAADGSRRRFRADPPPRKKTRRRAGSARRR